MAINLWNGLSLEEKRQIGPFLPITVLSYLYQDIIDIIPNEIYIFDDENIINKKYLKYKAKYLQLKKNYN